MSILGVLSHNYLRLLVDDRHDEILCLRHRSLPILLVASQEVLEILLISESLGFLVQLSSIFRDFLELHLDDVVFVYLGVHG